jgi:hypothetical protein
VTTTIKSDIWGEPEAECFYCGTPYNPEQSTAPTEFTETYCSEDCYKQDHVRMQLSVEQQQNQQAESTKKDEVFRMRIPRSKPEGA